MILKDKTFLITGILTDKSIAFATAKIAIDNGAKIIATGFGDGLRITQRAVKRLNTEIEVLEMDIEKTGQVQEVVNHIKDNYESIDGALHAIAFSPTQAMGGNFLTTNVEDAIKSFEVSAFSLKTLANEFLDIESFRLYMSVNNAFTFTKYKGFDPTTSSGAPIGGGFDQGFYPNPRTFSLGVNIKF